MVRSSSPQGKGSAIRGGTLRGTVTAIRKHLGCSQSKAAALRKHLVQHTQSSQATTEAISQSSEPRDDRYAAKSIQAAPATRKKYRPRALHCIARPALKSSRIPHRLAPRRPAANCIKTSPPRGGQAGRRTAILKLLEPPSARTTDRRPHWRARLPDRPQPAVGQQNALGAYFVLYLSLSSNLTILWPCMPRPAIRPVWPKMNE